MTADVWLPGAYRDPGRNAGYNAGRSQMVRAVADYTVGSDSRNVGRDGYFHFLVHRDASREHGCTQYVEVDAITWHAANAGNPYGPGIEWERLVVGGVNDEGLSEAEPLTPNQLDWGARLIDYLAEWGITPALYDGPRYECGHWRGWVNHQAIDASRSDGLLRAEWESMLRGGAPAPEPEQEDEDMPFIVYDSETRERCWEIVGNVAVVGYPPEPRGDLGIPQTALDRGLKVVAYSAAAMDMLLDVSERAGGWGDNR